MSESMAIIRRVIEEHQSIRGKIKLVGESLSDQEAITSLKRARVDWIPGRLEILAEKQGKLQQTLNFLEEGLENHFAFEEEALPPLFGELLMRALLLDHREIRKEIAEAKSMAPDLSLEGLSREELILKESQIQGLIDGICRLIEEHAAREEVILGMLQRALQEE